MVYTSAATTTTSTASSWTMSRSGSASTFRMPARLRSIRAVGLFSRHCGREATA